MKTAPKETPWWAHMILLVMTMGATLGGVIVLDHYRNGPDVTSYHVAGGNIKQHGGASWSQRY